MTLGAHYGAQRTKRALKTLILIGSRILLRSETEAYGTKTGTALGPGVLGIKAAGTGLNLFKATRVIFLELIWSCNDHLQAEDRAHRIGQTNKVTYIDMVSPDTIDEKILKALRSKIDIAGQVLGEDAKDWLT